MDTKHTLKRGLHALAAVATVLFAPMGVVAQEQGAENFALEEIIVQARRRDESLQDVPLSISAVSEAALIDNGIDDLVELQRLVPGLNIQEGINENVARIFIRGAGTVTPTIGVEPAVPIYIDDVYTPLGLGATLDLFSLERVEVLRGPQATLYGRNSFGGAIKVYTKEPSDEFEGRVSFTTGTENKRDLKAELSAPLVQEKLWLNLAGASLAHDGYQTFNYTGGEGWAENSEIFRAKLTANPTDNLTLKLTYDTVSRNAPTKQAKVLASSNPDPTAQVGFLQFLLDQAAQAETGDPMATGPILDTPVFARTGDVDTIETDVASNGELEMDSLAWFATWDVSDQLTVKYIGSSRDVENIRAQDVDSSPLEVLNVQERFVLDSESHELQVHWGGDRLNVIAGLFRYDESSAGDQLVLPFFFPLNSPLIDPAVGTMATARRDILGQLTGADVGQFSSLREQETESSAAYANFGFAVSDQFRITAGVRWTRDEKSLDTPIDPIVFAGATDNLTGDIIPDTFGVPTNAIILGQGIPPQGAGNATFEKVTPELTFDYRLNDSWLLFASYKEGFQGGTIFTRRDTGSANEVIITDEQTVDAFEIGFKSSGRGGRLTLNGAAFLYDYSDLVLSVPTPVPLSVSGSGLQGLPQNAAGARSFGFELDSVYRPSESFLVYANMAFTDFEITSGTAPQPDGMGGFIDVELSDYLYDEMPTLTPKWQANLGGEYNWDTNSGNTRVYVNAAYRDDVGTNSAPTFETSGIGLVLNDANRDGYTSESWTNVGLGLSYVPNDGNWRLDAGVTNVLDTRRPVATVFVSPGFFGTAQQYNTPRLWQLGVTFDF